MTMQKHQRGIVEWLRETGAEGVHIAQSGKHPRVFFRWRGDERSYVLPSSPGDTLRGQVNAIADLRRILGLVSNKRRVGERRRRKVRVSHRPAAALSPVSLVPAEDWREALGAMRGRTG